MKAIQLTLTSSELKAIGWLKRQFLEFVASVVIIIASFIFMMLGVLNMVAGLYFLPKFMVLVWGHVPDYDLFFGIVLYYLIAISFFACWGIFFGYKMMFIEDGKEPALSSTKKPLHHGNNHGVDPPENPQADSEHEEPLKKC